MNGLRGLAWLLALQSLGELLARGLKLPFPGPVIGMLLLLLALRWPLVREPVAACADFLLSHLSLLFVPVGVGVMTHLGLVSQYGGRMLLVIVLSLILTPRENRSRSTVPLVVVTGTTRPLVALTLLFGIWPQPLISALAPWAQSLSLHVTSAMGTF